MKQFELHPASESYYRKEGAVNCSRRLSAAILPLVATIVCTFLVLAVSSTTAYAAVGDTFIKEGLTYKVANDSYEVEIIDCDESASSVNVRTSIMYGEGALQDSYSVVGVSEDAFSDYEGTVVLEQNASSFYENIFNSLPEGAKLVLNCAKLPMESDTTIQLLSMASYVLEADGATQTINLPNGRSFSEIRVEPADGLTVLNKSDAPISLQCMSAYTGTYFAVELAAGDQYSTSWLWPSLNQFSYSVNGGESVLVEGAGTQTNYSVELPAETPLDATITVDISSLPGIAKGYVTSSWENNTQEITLENGKATTEVTLTPRDDLGGSDFPLTTTIEFPVPATDQTVWIGGVRHDEAFSDEGITLSYEEGTPVVTLDGATIKQAGGPNASGYALYAQSDLSVRLAEGSDNYIYVGESGRQTGALYAGGELSLVSEGGSNPGSLNIGYTQYAFDSSQVSGVVSADTLWINASLNVVYRENAQGGMLPDAPLTLLYAENDINLGARSAQITLGATGERSLYGAMSRSGNIYAADCGSLSVNGDILSALYSVEGDISLGDHTDVSLTCAGGANPGIVNALKGTVAINPVSGSGSIVVTSQDATTPAYLAKNIELVEGAIFAEPESAKIGETTDSVYGTCATIVDQNGSVASKVIVSNERAAEITGKTMGDCFSENALGEAIWTDVLKKSDSYDPSYVITGEDAHAIISCSALTLDIYQSTDFGSGGISNLPSLEALLVRTHDNGQIEVSLGDLSLDALYVDVDKVQALSFNGDDVRIREFDIAPASPAYTDYSLQSLVFGDGVEVSSFGASDLNELTELKLPSSVNSLWLDNLSNLTQLDLTSWENLQNLNLQAVGIDGESGLKLDLSHNTQLTSVTLRSLNLSGELSLQALSQVENIRLEFVEGLSELDLSQNHALTDVYVSFSGLEKIVFADDAVLTSLELGNNQLTELTIPQAAQLETLSVGKNKLTSLNIPENSKATLKSLYAYQNNLASLDLSGMKLELCLLKAATATGPEQYPSFEGVLQENGTVTVNLSGLAANIVSIDPGSEGKYDAETGILTFSSAEAAKAGFSYVYDTKGEVLNEDDAAVDLSRAYGAEGEALSEDGSGYVPVYMEVSAQVALGSSSDGGDSEGDSGDASNNDDSIQQALAATGDKLVIPGLLVCAVASAAVVLIAWRKISQN